MSNIYNIIFVSVDYDVIQLKFNNNRPQKHALPALSVFKLFEITFCINMEEGSLHKN